MKQEIKEKWVNALLSGEYKQYNNEIRYNDSYSPFGVLCDLYRKEHSDNAYWIKDEDCEWVFRVKDDIESSVIPGVPNTVAKWFGFNLEEPPFYVVLLKFIMIKNIEGVSFNEIANIVKDL